AVVDGLLVVQRDVAVDVDFDGRVAGGRAAWLRLEHQCRRDRAISLGYGRTWWRWQQLGAPAAAGALGRQGVGQTAGQPAQDVFQRRLAAALGGQLADRLTLRGLLVRGPRGGRGLARRLPQRLVDLLEQLSDQLADLLRAAGCLWAIRGAANAALR